ncbi:hypothetical protein [Acetobacter cibinongensis]|uniref:hypothetical protein n=1 Tax=Acetobacter cibinongensis TaxID=146475 RepID=UPI003530B487
MPPRKTGNQNHHVTGIFIKSAIYIEHMFAKLKDWRCVVVKYDRCAHTFMSAIHIAASFICYLKE